MDSEVIMPLYFAAVKCRHGRVRRKAISSLRSQQRQEGVWNSFLIAKVAERSMQIEEEELEGTEVVVADILKCKRVLGVEVRFDLQAERSVFDVCEIEREWWNR
jgi:hypothetical protein